MKNFRAVMFLLVGILLSVASVGCGGGRFHLAPWFPSAVASTAHPLVAQYSIRFVPEGSTAWVEFGTDRNYARQTSSVTSSAPGSDGQTINILVAGMVPQTTYHMRAHVEGPSFSWVDADHVFTTGALPNNLVPPSITVTQLNANLAPAPGVELLSLVQPPNTTPTNTSMLQSVVTDLQGNVIWYYPAGATPVKTMSNGHIILQLVSDLREVDLAGDTIRDVSVSQVNQSLQANGYSFSIISFSHDVLVLENGHWITIGRISKDFADLPGYPGTTSVVGDAVVDIDPSGNVVWGWSAFDHLEANRHLQGLPDWTHSNALVYTPDANLLLSMRHQSWILKLDYENGKGSGDVLWKLGEDGDFTLLGGDPSQWFYGQHYPDILSSNGSQMTLAVYDDGNLRIDSSGVGCESSDTAPACYSRATIFQLDESTNLASLLWQDFPGFFSFWGGSIVTLSNGDVEFTNSDPFDADSAQILEVTQNSTPQIVWQMNINNEWAYRGYRIPSLYPGVTWQK